MYLWNSRMDWEFRETFLRWIYSWLGKVAYKQKYLRRSKDMLEATWSYIGIPVMTENRCRSPFCFQMSLRWLHIASRAWVETSVKPESYEGALALLLLKSAFVATEELRTLGVLRCSSCWRRAASAGELAATALRLRSTDKRTIG